MAWKKIGNRLRKVNLYQDRMTGNVYILGKGKRKYLDARKVL